MHLNVLRKLATSPNALRSSNHTLPMVDEVHIGHLVFGVFPFVGAAMKVSWDDWPRNSVGDIMNMFLQALEVSTSEMIMCLALKRWDRVSLSFMI